MQKWLGLLRGVLLAVAAVSLVTCTYPQRHLTSAQVASCRAEGGFESRSAFGHPICQIGFVDAGKICRSKSDCNGRCLVSMDGAGPWPKSGDFVAGTCESHRYTPGCFATVEGGKLQDDTVCEE